MSNVTLLQRILLSLAFVILSALIFFTIFGDNGLLELRELRRGKAQLVESNETLIDENLSLYHTIDRLKYDTRYIGNVARNELGMIGRDEIIFKFAKDQKKK